MSDCAFSVLVGLTLTNIELAEDKSEVILWADLDRRKFKMHHEQDCCESVYLEDIIGDLSDLLLSPILEAEEVMSSDPPPEGDRGDESHTWTFYKVRTRKGFVTLRWYGSSNGYYSERTSFEEIPYS